MIFPTRIFLIILYSLVKRKKYWFFNAGSFFKSNFIRHKISKTCSNYACVFVKKNFQNTFYEEIFLDRRKCKIFNLFSICLKRIRNFSLFLFSNILILTKFRYLSLHKMLTSNMKDDFNLTWWIYEANI